MYFPLEQGMGVDAVIENLIRKAYRLKGHEAINVGAIWAGGTMRVVASAGYTSAFGTQLLHNAIGPGLAVSGGVIPLMFLYADQPELAARAAATICATRTFINPWRKPILDNDRLVRSLQRGPLAIDMATFMHDSRPFYAAASTLDGEPRLLDVKAAKDPFKVMRAVIALPGRLDGKRIEIDGEAYLDQVVLTPDQIQWFVGEHHLTDVLFSPNRSELPLPREIAHALWREQLTMLPALFFDLLVRTVLLRGLSRRYWEHARQLRQMFQEGLEWLIFNRDVRLAILPLPMKAGVGNLTTNRKKLRRAISGAERVIEDAYAQALQRLRQPQAEPSFPPELTQKIMSMLRAANSRTERQTRT